MEAGAHGVALIQHFEGCYSSVPNSAANGKIKPKPVSNLHNLEQTLYSYRCSANVPTIGWGNTKWTDGSPVQDGDECTLDDANILFAQELAEFSHGVDKLLKAPVTQNQFDALVSFCYNLGPANLKSSTLLKKVNANPNDPNIAQEFNKWVRGGGKVLPGLVNRRKSESELYFKK